MELSVLILARNEAPNLVQLLPEIRSELLQLGVSHEIVVVDGNSVDGTAAVAAENGCRVIEQRLPHYGGAMREGIAATDGRFLLTLDADFTHPASFIRTMWDARHFAEIVIASRYVEGGASKGPAFRKFLSRLLNGLFATALRLPVRDLSSGFRLYRRNSISGVEYRSTDFDILLEILILALCRKARIVEVPFEYQPRRAGSSKARVLHLVVFYLRTLRRLAWLRWVTSSSIAPMTLEPDSVDSLGTVPQSQIRS